MVFFQIELQQLIHVLVRSLVINDNSLDINCKQIKIKTFSNFIIIILHVI